MRKNSGVTLTLLIFLLSAQALSNQSQVITVGVEEVKVGPYLESVLGVQTVMVRGHNGVIRPLIQGYRLEWGDSFLTGAQGSMRLTFDQNTQVLITPESYITVELEKDGQGFIGTPFLKLHQGDIRVLVKPQNHEKTEVISPRRHRFIIGTSSLILGVQGTDFIVTADSKHSEVYVLSGVVDAGRGLKPIDLESENTQAITSGQMTRSTRGIVATPEPYLINPYLKAFHGKFPLLLDLWRLAIVDAQSGRLDTKFEKARLDQMHEVKNNKKRLLKINPLQVR